MKEREQINKYTTFSLEAVYEINDYLTDENKQVEEIVIGTKNNYEITYENDKFYNRKQEIKFGKILKNLTYLSESEIKEMVEKRKEEFAESVTVNITENVSTIYNIEHKAGNNNRSCMCDNGGYFKALMSALGGKFKIAYIKKHRKIIARALVWTGTTKDRRTVQIMDRQYGINQSEINKLRKYARENGMYYRLTNSYEPTKEFANINNDIEELEITIDLKHSIQIKEEYMPFLDTFKFSYMDNYDEIDYLKNVKEDVNVCFESTEGSFQYV